MRSFSGTLVATYRSPPGVGRIPPARPPGWLGLRDATSNCREVGAGACAWAEYQPIAARAAATRRILVRLYCLSPWAGSITVISHRRVALYETPETIPRSNGRGSLT